MATNNERTIMTASICLACRSNPGITIIEDRWTPLCSACLDRLGTPVKIGQRAVCHIGSTHGIVVRFDGPNWAESGLAEIVQDSGATGWYPLAELAPAN